MILWKQLLVILMWSCCLCAEPTFFAGALSGVSTLSADGRSVFTSGPPSISLYKPENGVALNVVAGTHLGNFLSVQANYVWNRNELTLTSATDAGAYEQTQTSSQNAVLGDLLVYFRDRRSWLRPYLSVGSGLVHFKSTATRTVAISGVPTSVPGEFSSTQPALRVAVGIDLPVGRNGWVFRYSFSETIRKNPISAQLSPPGQRNLANFQNLFGLLKQF